MALVITLPWPDKALSPNGRAHWRTVAKAKGQAKHDAYFLTAAANSGKDRINPQHDDVLKVTATFHPKTRNVPDADNCLASLKASLDGIAAALGIDDRQFRPVPIIADPIKGGKVVVQLTLVEAE